MNAKLFALALMALQLNVFAGINPPEDYVAHEWGTFTSVQGADGIQMAWNPLVTTELPGFVYDRNRPHGGPPAADLAALSSKSAFITLQRMETPVIYFYSARERKVDVAVKFPEGIITEWYPQVTPLSSTDTRDMELLQQHGVRWSEVQVLPHASNPGLGQSLPNDPSGSHYYAARQTDADFLRLNQKEASKQEYEKFLFYRGVGSFRAPLQASLGASESEIDLKNTGSEALTDFIVLKIRRTQENRLVGQFTYVGRLASGASRIVQLSTEQAPAPLDELRPRIMQRMIESLTASGLYAAEASAMVQTWQDSWFGEEGLRVLYVLPRKWTDQILPLTLQPQPSQLVRVMVGRAEMITPTMEQQLLRQVVRFSESDEAARPRIVAETRELGLGRFTEPTMRRVLSKLPKPGLAQPAQTLLEALKPHAKDAKGLAAK